jgi:Zn-finger nucleic acid-binding protein
MEIMLDCPRDGARLVSVDLDGLHLDTCPVCAGLWFDLGELRRAEELEDHDLHWLEFTLWRDEGSFELTPTPMRCPRCSERLGSALYHDTGVLVHMCPSCEGTWLDHGDLEFIVRHLEAELHALPTSSLVAASVREAAVLVGQRGALATDWADLRGLLQLVAKRVGSRNQGLLARLVQAMRETPLT